MVILFLYGGKIMASATFQKEVLQVIEGFVNNKQNKINGDATIDKSSLKGNVLYVDYLSTKKDKIQELINTLSVFGINYSASKRESTIPKLGSGKTLRFKLGRKSPYTTLISFRKYEISSGQLPTAIQERGSTFVLERAVRNRKKKFKSLDDLKNDTDIMEVLKDDVFRNYQDKLDNWLYTYYEQQRTFIEEYSLPQWEKFTYDGDDFVKFFSKYIIDPDLGLYNDFNGDKVKKYTEWNPADIYAVKNMKKVKDDLDKIFHKKNKNKTGASMIELNGYLINVLKKKQLVGISLKQIGDKAIAVLEERNTQATKFKDPHIEDKNFTINDIKFHLDNIWKGDFVSTTVKYGTSFALSVRSSSSSLENLVFATQITGASAQGGNAPTAMVIKLIHGSNVSNGKFINDHNLYPSTFEEFFQEKPSARIKFTTSNYETWFNFVKKKFKGSPRYQDFEEKISQLYYSKSTKNAAIAQTKLMQLHFFYDTLQKYETKIDFWLDLLYLGMKVGKIFAPHAKIY